MEKMFKYLSTCGTSKLDNIDYTHFFKEEEFLVYQCKRNFFSQYYLNYFLIDQTLPKIYLKSLLQLSSVL